MSDMVSEVLGQTKDAEEQFSSTEIKIVTVGLGGAGCNIVNRLIKVGVKGTEFIAVNTDAQHFKIIDERIKKVLIGKTLTRGWVQEETRLWAQRRRRWTGRRLRTSSLERR